MSKEQPPPSPEHFAFTYHEKLFDQLGDKRFQTLLTNQQTQIHQIDLSSNTFGEFLFVTVSYPQEEHREALTFFGLGFHEYRERWITETWSWYEASREATSQILVKEQAIQQIADRRTEITPYAQNSKQSKRAKLYEMLADLTDEDGALTELEDMGDWFELDE